MKTKSWVSDGVDGRGVADTSAAGIPTDAAHDADLVGEREPAKGSFSLAVGFVPSQLGCRQLVSARVRGGFQQVSPETMGRAM